MVYSLEGVGVPDGVPIPPYVTPPFPRKNKKPPFQILEKTKRTSAMHDIEVKTNDKLRTSVLIDGKEINGIRKIDFHTSVDEVPTFNLELVGIPDMSVLGDVFILVTPKNVTDAVKILRNELLAHGEIYNGFIVSIKSAILETGHYDILSMPFEFAEVIAQDILDFVIGKEE